MEYVYNKTQMPDPNMHTLIPQYQQSYAPINNLTSNIPVFNPPPQTIPLTIPQTISQTLPQSNYIRPYLYQQSDPRFKQTTIKPAEVLDQKSDDELWIETYLSKIGKISLSLQSSVEIISKKPAPAPRTTTHKKTLKIHVAKNLLHRCLKLLEELKKLENYLRINVATITSTEWKQKTVEIGQQKDEFTALLSQIEDSSVLNNLRKALKKRKKKRISQKRKKIAIREEKEETLKNIEIQHEILNKWLVGEKEKQEKERKKAEMKKNADCILAEVTKKKSEARKQLLTLTSLVKLRAVREAAALARGENISLEDSKTFKESTEKLQKMWEDALRTYSDEEQSLRTTIEKACENEEDIAAFEKQNIIAEWESILFGPKVIPSEIYWALTCADKDLRTFIAIRKSWDTFLVPKDNRNGTRIPIGWVLPEPNNSEWTKYLKKDN